MKKLLFALVSMFAGVAIELRADAPATTNVIEKGDTFVVSSDADVAQLAGSQLILRGTLDLNGHDVSVTAMSCLSGEFVGTQPIASTEAKITNSGAGTPTFTVQGGSAYFTGSVDPSVNFVFNGGEMQMIVKDQAFAPAKLTVLKGTFMAFSNPTVVCFVFHDVAAESAEEKKLRLGELMLTRHGVAVEATRKFIGHVSMNETWYDLLAATYAYWSSGAVIPEGGAAVSFQPGNSGVSGAIGCTPVDGYRMATSDVPCYTPTSWDVYFKRSDNIGLVLVDSRRNDSLNRPQINPSAEKDTYSNQLSQNYSISSIGAPFGANTDIELASGAKLRVSSMDACVAGSVTGAGTILIDDGTTFAPKSLANWAGKFTTQYSTNFLREAKVRIPESGWNAALDNKELMLVGDDSALVCDGASTPNPLTARLSDGEKKLGLTVQVGAGNVQDLHMQNAAYSGETKIESGTLRVLGAMDKVTCRYIRIAPKKMNGVDSSNKCYWGMNEFEVYDASGKKVSLAGATVTTTAKGTPNVPGGWNSTATDGSKLIDGDPSNNSRMLPKDYDAAGNLPTVTIAMKSPVTFSSYRWYTSTLNANIQESRFPLELAIEVSSDGEDWMIVDLHTQVKPGSPGWIGGDTGFPLNGGFDESAAVPTLPEQFMGTSSKGAGFVETIKAQYFRLRPYETFYGGKFEGQYDYGWHVSEFSLLKDGEIVPWPAGCTFISTGHTTMATTYGNDIHHFADNVHTGGVGNVSDAVRVFLNQCGSTVEVNAQSQIEFDAYMLWNGPGNVKRMPRTWTVDVALEKGKWYNLDNHKACDDDVCPGVYAPYGPFSLKNRWPISEAPNAIGDYSPVSISEGAALEMIANYERIGGLAGLGSVLLHGSNLALSGVGGAAYAGQVAGGGTLTLCEGVQAFDGADLTGVSELAFAGGAFAGSATFGALKVSGDVTFSLPEDVVKNGGSVTVFTYDSVDDASKALIEAAKVLEPLRRTAKLEISVGAKATTVTVAVPGFMIIVK